MNQVTMDVPVRFPMSEAEALQLFKDKFGLNTRSKAARLLIQIGLRYLEGSGQLNGPDEGRLFTVSVSVDLQRRVKSAADDAGLRVPALLADLIEASFPEPNSVAEQQPMDRRRKKSAGSPVKTLGATGDSN